MIISQVKGGTLESREEKKKEEDDRAHTVGDMNRQREELGREMVSENKIRQKKRGEIRI